MKRISFRLIINPGWLVTGLLLAQSAPARSAQFHFPGHTITVPDGFEVELVGGPPLVDRPIMGDFDEQGRLYVADSAGVTDTVQKQLQTRPHRILRLEDSTGNGRFDQRTVFADHMMFPEGVLWFDGAVYCAAPPTIWKLEDTDGDGVADRRSEWYRGLTLTGCANDLHGPYLGLDGWIYWCKGAFAQQTHERPGRPTISDSAAHIFRCRPDGSDFDSVMSGGMDNPVEIAFTPEGETIFSTTFYSHPESGKRDALVHAVYGGVYPKVHGVLDGLKRTGDLLPPLTHLGPAAACALMRYSSSAFGPEYQGNLFSSLFNLRKVMRHVLRQSGSTFASTDTDFFVSDNPDFHPTDVLEDADGSLLIIDTGGWYKICCPTSQLAKPEVLGAIYRVRRRGAPQVQDPRGLKLNWTALKPAELAALLGDPRPAIVKRALARLAQQGSAAVPALATAVQHASTIEARQNAVWALTRIDGADARAAVRAALADPETGVRQAATHSVGLRRDAAALPALLAQLATPSLHLLRNTATALGQLGDKTAVPALLAATALPHDRFLEHSLIYALIELDDADATAKGISADSPFTRRAALIALDQMPSGHLSPASVIPHLSSTDAILKQTAFWIVDHRPEWGRELSGLYREWLRDAALSKTRAAELQPQLSRLASDPAMQQMLAATLLDPAVNALGRSLALGAMAHTVSKTVPEGWTQALTAALHQADLEVARQAVLAVRSLPFGRSGAQASDSGSSELTASLLEVARDVKRPDDLRLAAASALPAGLQSPEPALVQFLLNNLDAAKPPLDRAAAATTLGRAKLDTSQLTTLAEALRMAGPMELPKLLGAFDQATNEALGLKLVAALRGAPAFASLRPDAVKPHFEKYPEAVQTQVKELLAGLGPDTAKQQAVLDHLEAALHDGDRERGRRIFESTKTACATCHQIGYVGGKVGPDLTKIGSIRTRRDLLEAVVYPSASFVRAYEPYIVTTKDGEDYSGVMRQESADSIVIVSGPGAEQRIATAEIAQMRAGTVSVMPEGLTQPLTVQEVSDLMAFLGSLK